MEIILNFIQNFWNFGPTNYDYAYYGGTFIIIAFVIYFAFKAINHFREFIVFLPKYLVEFLKKSVPALFFITVLTGGVFLLIPKGYASPTPLDLAPAIAEEGEPSI